MRYYSESAGSTNGAATLVLRHQVSPDSQLINAGDRGDRSLRFCDRFKYKPSHLVIVAILAFIKCLAEIFCILP